MACQALEYMHKVGCIDKIKEQSVVQYK